MLRSHASLVLLLGVILASCSSEEGGSSKESPSDDQESPTAQGLTYHGDAKAIVDARCATCHRSGDIGPFPLTTYEEVKSLEGAVRSAIERGTMPPWQPSDECNDFQDDIDLTEEEKTTLLGWLDAGAPEGDPSEAPEETVRAEALGFEADLQLQLPEPYAPQLEPDDYRCQLIPWPAEETRYVTGVRVVPDQRAIVHHVIVFVVGPDQIEQYQAWDDAEEGPGYTCYGGPTASSEGGGLNNIDPATLLPVLQELGLTLADLQSGNVTEEQSAAIASALGIGGGFQSLGNWVPGTPSAPFPAGTGIRVEPGSMLVAQMHYNTLAADSVPDQSIIELATVESVEREATMLTAVDVGWVSNGRLGGDPMTIPAGDADVEHATEIAFDSVLVTRARNALGLAEDAPLALYSANHHMHELGTSQRSEILHSDGSSSCLLDIPDWDFAWQGSYTFSDPMELQEGDVIRMGCTWDNSPGNQPVIDGQMRMPVDVSWGEGTTDEMCLGAFYVTGL